MYGTKKKSLIHLIVKFRIVQKKLHGKHKGHLCESFQKEKRNKTRSERLNKEHINAAVLLGLRFELPKGSLN